MRTHRPDAMPQQAITQEKSMASTTAANPARGRCPECSQPLDCAPSGHHCPDCGFHDDTPCDRQFPDPHPGEQRPDAIPIPADLFDTIALAYRRRDFYRQVTGEHPFTHAIRELAAAIATGSRRLSPDAAYRLTSRLAALGSDENWRQDEEDTWFAMRELLTPGQLAACDGARAAEDAAAEAEYRAWRLEQAAGRPHAGHNQPDAPKASTT